MGCLGNHFHTQNTNVIQENRFMFHNLKKQLKKTYIQKSLIKLETKQEAAA